MSEYPCPKCGGEIKFRKDPCVGGQEHGTCQSCRLKTDTLKQDWHGMFAPVLLAEIRRKDAEIERLRGILESHAPDGHNCTNWEFHGVRETASRRLELLRRVATTTSRANWDELMAEIQEEVER